MRHRAKLAQIHEPASAGFSRLRCSATSFSWWFAGRGPTSVAGFSRASRPWLQRSPAIPNGATVQEARLKPAQRKRVGSRRPPAKAGGKHNPNSEQNSHHRIASLPPILRMPWDQRVCERRPTKGDVVYSPLRFAPTLLRSFAPTLPPYGLLVIIEPSAPSAGPFPFSRTLCSHISLSRLVSALEAASCSTTPSKPASVAGPSVR